MKIIEERKLEADAVRNICIKMDWYTCGTNDEYSRMLGMADDTEATPERIYEIAKDIVEHSHMERYYNSGYTKKDVIENVMCYIGCDAAITTYHIKL